MNNDMSEFYRKQTKSQHEKFVVQTEQEVQVAKAPASRYTWSMLLEIISSLRFVVEPKHKRLLTRFMEKISTRFGLWGWHH